MGFSRGAMTGMGFADCDSGQSFSIEYTAVPCIDAVNHYKDESLIISCLP